MSRRSRHKAPSESSPPELDLSSDRDLTRILIVQLEADPGHVVIRIVTGDQHPAVEGTKPRRDARVISSDPFTERFERDELS